MAMKHTHKEQVAMSFSYLIIATTTKFIRLLRAVWRWKRISLPASMTVEASMVLPFFLFFFLNILSMFNILKMQCDMEAALHQTGNRIAKYTFDVRYGLGEVGIDTSDSDILTAAVDTAFAEKGVKEYLGKEYLDNSCILNGSEGLTFYKSLISSDADIVNIVASYKAKPYLGIIGFKAFRIENSYYGHAWTGYDYNHPLGIADNAVEEMVYVTEWGEVYHRNIDCTHLKLSISQAKMSEVKHKRNEGGSRYYKCEYCGNKENNGTVYITNYGNRYHTSINCQGLKRTIYTVPLSEVGGIPPCSKCGG